jgi:AraC-like DNA-binding protein
MKIGDCSVSVLRALQAAVSAEGLDPAPLLESFGISEALLATPHARISLSRYMRIGAEAIRLTNKPWLGLQMGKNMHVGNMGLAGWAAMTAPTLSDALSTHIRFDLLSSKNIRGAPRYHLDPDTGNPICQLYSLAPYNRFNYFCVDSILSSWFGFSQWVTGHTELLKQVEIEYPDVGYRDKLEEFFQCPVSFGQDRNALIFSRRARQLPSRLANPSNHQQALLLCERELVAVLGNSTLRDRVRDIIAALLPGRPPTIEDVANKVGMASWTLRRRLKAEGAIFQELLDHTRKELAESYVIDSIHSFTEISYMLGFSSPVAFHRAFKRWRGVSPGQYRKSR